MPALTVLLAAAAIRTVVYQFAYDAHGFGGAPSINTYGIVNEGGSFGAGGRTGQITVNVVEATPDGGLVVDVGEMIDRAAKPLQTIRCGIYGASTDVVCDQNVGSTPEETALLTFLGREFYDSAKLDRENHWRTEPKFAWGAVKVENDFTVTSTSGSLLTLAVDHTERAGGYQATEKGTVVYDAPMEIPTSVHLAATAQRAGSQRDATVDLTLLSDSMAKTASQTPH